MSFANLEQIVVIVPAFMMKEFSNKIESHINFNLKICIVLV